MKQKISFQGELGAYSHEVTVKHFGSEIDLLPCESFSKLLDSVTHGKATCAILPIENSIAGSVFSAYDELLRTNLYISQEIIYRIRHYLLIPPKSDLEDIREVYSHPQALSQCFDSCLNFKLLQKPFYDTAGAARYISTHEFKDKAAIASYSAAKIYNLKVVGDSFEDAHYNETRFLIISGRKFDKSRDELLNYDYKTTIIFKTSHIPNSLARVLNILARHNINLTKIESRPSRKAAWEYVFFVDF